MMRLLILCAVVAVTFLIYQISNFDFLIGVSNEPVLLTVRADSPDKTLEDLVKRAKAEGKVIRYGNSGMGTVPYLCLAYLFQLSGVKSQPVPYKSNTPALAALMGGHLDVSAAHPGEAIPQIKAGKIRALAISSTKRFDSLPDVPTMQELGYQIDMGVKKFVMVPKGMPTDVRAILLKAFEQAAADQEFVKAMQDIYLMLEPMNGAQVAEYLNKEAPLMKKLIAEIPASDTKQP
jgi:tripartite-type tricarboxylate transporter receptor subunit TctC